MTLQKLCIVQKISVVAHVLMAADWFL